MEILGLKPKKPDFTISEQDAAILEDNEQTQLRNMRTRRAIHDTYNPKSPTKKRRKLPGKRKWKNKIERNKALEGHMTVRQFNAKSKAMRVLDKVYKKQAKQRQKHSLVD